ncbi:MAG: hypothetical protein ACKOQS_07040 [Dolichospermum sp.]
MSSIFRKGKYRLIWLVLAIALGLSTIICEDSDRFSPNFRTPGNFCVGW